MALFRKKQADKPELLADEASTLGAILIALGHVSRDMLEESITEQKLLSRDEMLGRMLVSRGALDPGHLQAALVLQRKLRSRKAHIRALAQAQLAEMTSARTVLLAQELRQETAKVRRESSGFGYPAIGTNAAALLLKAGGHGGR